MPSITSIVQVLLFIKKLWNHLYFFITGLFYAPTHAVKRTISIVSLNATVSNGLTYQGVYMNLVIRKKEQIVFTPQFRDEDGNLTTDLGSIPVWTSSNPAVLTVSASEDGLVATAVPTGALGEAQIRLVVDADPGADVMDLVGEVNVRVKAGLAMYIELNPTIAAVVQAVEPAPTEPAPTEPVEPTEPTEPTVQEPEPVEQPVEPEQPAAEPVAVVDTNVGADTENTGVVVDEIAPQTNEGATP